MREQTVTADSESLLIVGAGGLLGRAVVKAARGRGEEPVTASVRWNTAHAVSDLCEAFDRIVAMAPGEWRLVWCAGAGVTATEQEALDAELDVLNRFVAHVARSPHAAGGTFFVASSAGALYAGASGPPFSELDDPCPRAPYGRAKLAAESVVAGLTQAGVAVVVGRITNLYGPGQNLAKPQGLISQLCLTHHLGRSLGIYVSLDTLRDYLYVADCAEIVLDLVARAAGLEPSAEAVVKIVGSYQSVSIAALLGEMRRVFKRRPTVVLSASRLASAQARDLRFRSLTWTDLDRRQLTPLPAGLAATYADIGHRASRYGAIAA